METVSERLARAQASGDLDEVRAALIDARAAGADPDLVEQAMAEAYRARDAAAEPPPSDETSAVAASSSFNRAEKLKLQGNNKLKEGGKSKSEVREAVLLFTDGIAVHCEDAMLNSQLYCNRGLAMMLLHQFVEAVDDCRKAVEFDPKNVKAYWRAAKASLHLGLAQNGVDFCEAGLLAAPKDPDLARMRDVCAQQLGGQKQRKKLEASRRLAAGDVNPDEALAMQDRIRHLAEQVATLKARVTLRQREKVKAQLTRTTLADETPATCLVYRTLGRCYLRQENTAIVKDLEGTVARADEELPKLLQAQEELEAKKSTAEEEFQELLQAFRAQQHSEGTTAIS